MERQLETQDIGREGISAGWWLVMPIAVALLLVAASLGLPDLYAVWIESERGLLELSHIVIPLAGFFIALRILALPRLRRQPLLIVWVGVAAAACLYVAGEEASWGQHFLDWSTPETWQAINDQQETNLHNVSSWFDQKPRALLEIGVIVGGLLIPVLGWLRPAIRESRLAVILPPFLCLPTAVLAEVTRLPERIAEATGNPAPIFARASEVQELYFYLFILFYLIVLRQRLTAAASR